ncbi:hypothetical protein MPSEU_000992100 [Mayamaea pseudoterrestris]|nr:hypothetical protein MPSEU_000992100 [Mayamaea pseudoterrestris]
MTTFNFAKGHPNRDLVPVQEMKALLNRVGSSDSTLSSDDDEQALQASLNYGDEAGQANLLQELQFFLQRQCLNDEGPACTSNSFFVTGGVSHGIELLCAVATQPNDRVWVEDPTYFLAANIFQSHGLIIESLPMQHAGVVDMDALEAQLSDCVASSRPLPRILYIVPTHQNPTGRTMPLKHRFRIAKLARQYQFLVVADEVYHLLDYRNDNGNGRDDGIRRPARMAMFNATQQDDVSDVFTSLEQTNQSTDIRSLLYGCCSVSSFTKIFAPGVRLGWIEAPCTVVDAIKQYGYIVSQGGVAPFMGHMFCNALRQRICDGVLDKLCLAYANRAKVLVAILVKESRIQLPCKPCGGYFLWVILPFEAEQFLSYCQPDLTFLLGTQCLVASDRSKSNGDSLDALAVELRQSLRLCFAYLSMEDLTRGAELFVSKFKSYVDQQVNL